MKNGASTFIFHVVLFWVLVAQLLIFVFCTEPEPSPESLQ